MSMSAPSDVAEFLASRPRFAFVANLFTFSLLSGPVYRFTDWRRPLPFSGHTYLPSPRVVRGSIRVERGMVTATQQVELQEPNDEFIGLIARGYFNRALYTMQRTFAPPPGADGVLQWLTPYTRFAGRVASFETVNRTVAKMTIKSMIDDLDNDYPRNVVQPDCDAVLFDGRCGLNASSFVVAGTASAGSTVNKLPSGLSNPDVYFTQGYVKFTSGALNGLAYMVKNYLGGVITPAYPFLVPPAAGDTFNAYPGCDKTLETCISKYGYSPSSYTTAPFFRGAPNVPDPTVTY